MAGVRRGITAPDGKWSSTPESAPASRMRVGFSSAERNAKTSSVDTIVAPCCSSIATSPQTSGTSPLRSPAWIGATARVCNRPSLHIAEADGLRLMTGTPAARRASSTSRFNLPAAAATSAKPRQCSGLCAPARVLWRRAAVWPNEPDPCPIRSVSCGCAFRARAISPARRASTSRRGVSG